MERKKNDWTSELQGHRWMAGRKLLEERLGAAPCVIIVRKRSFREVGHNQGEIHYGGEYGGPILKV